MGRGSIRLGYNRLMKSDSAKIKSAADKNSQKSSGRLVLLDAHAILHRAYHALPDFVSSKGEPTGALYGLSTMLIKIIADLKPDYIAACFDLPKPTYRHEMYKEYKAGRAKSDEALIAQMKRSRDVFTAFGIPIYDYEGFEADDILGSIVGKLAGQIEIIIASGDMDTLQLIKGDSVRVYTLKKGLNDTIMYDEVAVQERFGFGPELLPDYKGLRGDPSDNIIGIKGIGEKTAGILINTFGPLEKLYELIHADAGAAQVKFKEVGLTERIFKLIQDGEEEALFSKVLATIRRDAPIDFVLPARKWREEIATHTNNVKALFADLDFRTLGARFDDAMAGGGRGENKKAKKGGNGDVAKEVGASKEGEDSQEVQNVQEVQENIDPKELSETLVALWVVDSNITNPTLDDVYTFTNTQPGPGKFALARKIIFTELEKRGSLSVYNDIELPLIPILVDMKKHGIKINRDYLLALSKQYHTELTAIQAEIWRHAGEEFNVSSPKQLGEVLFNKLALKNGSGRQKKTPGGALSTKESELEKLIDEHPVVGQVLRYRELSKLLGTYIDPIPTMLDEGSRLHPTLIQAGAATGRMASTDPGVQNIPIKTEYGRRIRNAFITSEDYSIVSIDYSQMELRIAAILSRDEKLLEIFTTGKDVHTAVASQVFGVPEDKVDKEMRRRAKVINFGILYGMGVLALKQNLAQGGQEISRADSQKFYDEYFSTYSGLANYLNEVKAEANRKGYTETLFGRRRYFEGIRSKIPFIRAGAERMAINAPIQGTNADITKLAMIRIHEGIVKGELGNVGDVYMLIPVHDEILFEIRDNAVASVVPKIQNIMENILPAERALGVPIITEAYVGPSWGELTRFDSSSGKSKGGGK